jgi:hypothetical protein
MTDLTRAVIQEGLVDSICSTTIWRLLDQVAIKPHRWHYWLNSPDPDFYPKMYAIVELYLNALKMYERGDVLLSVDEKTSIQALRRKYPHKPMMSGRVERIEHEYKRHGTCCLTAGLEVATGEVMGYGRGYGFVDTESPCGSLCRIYGMGLSILLRRSGNPYRSG